MTVYAKRDPATDNAEPTAPERLAAPPVGWAQSYLDGATVASAEARSRGVTGIVRLPGMAWAMDRAPNEARTALRALWRRLETPQSVVSLIDDAWTLAVWTHGPAFRDLIRRSTEPVRYYGVPWYPVSAIERVGRSRGWSAWTAYLRVIDHERRYLDGVAA